MPKRTSDHHSWLLKQLTKPLVAANYLNAAMSDSPEMFLVALRNVAEAHKMAKVAGEAGVAREALYRTLSEEGNPRFDTLGAILKAVGLRIAIEAVVSSPGRSPLLVGAIDQIDPAKPDSSHRPSSSLRRLFASLSWKTAEIRNPLVAAQLTQTPVGGTALDTGIVASIKSTADGTAQPKPTDMGSALACAL